MRFLFAYLVLSVFLLFAGWTMVFTEWHRTIGYGGVALGFALLAGSLVSWVRGSRRVIGTTYANAPPRVKSGRNLRKVLAATLIIALTGIGVFFGTSYLASTGPTGLTGPTGGPTTSSSTTALKSNSTSSFSSVTTSTPPATPANLSLVVRTFGDLMGNYSQAEVRYATARQYGTASYSLTGTPVINSTRMFKALFNLSVTPLQSVTVNSSAIIWLSRSGACVIVDQNGANYTGSQAERLGTNFTSPFVTSIANFDLLAENSTISSHFQLVRDTTAHFGPIVMDVAIYSLPGSFVINSTFTVRGATFQIGTPLATSGGLEVPVVTVETFQSTRGLFASDLVSIER
jgi:hypothetical protein